MKQKLNIDTWARKEHFKFFSKFEEPFYGVCVSVDCTAAYQFAKQNKISFFLYTLYQSLSAANVLEPFKYRMEDDEVFIYDRIDGGSTVARPDGTFGYGYYQYYPTLAEFMIPAAEEVTRVQNSADLNRSTAQNIIRFSSLPWIDFTSISHARMFSVANSCPSISFGKMTESNGKRSMPMSVHVHHALVDGLHVGQYIDCLQGLLNQGI